MTWSATQYLVFDAQRSRPVRDLLVALPERLHVRSAVDVGCGPGNSTELLAARFPGACIEGFDHSPDMLEAARRRLPGASFTLRDLAEWAHSDSASPVGPFDVILANAVLQWLPDHRSLLTALATKLTRGGALAVQMPDNLDEPAHRLMREVAAGGPWAGKLAAAAAARTPLPTPPQLHAWLGAEGCAVDVWRTTYHHALADAGAIVEWFKGSGLRPFLDPLDAHERALFLARYRDAVAGAHPAAADGTVLLPFPRLFFVAVRA